MRTSMSPGELQFICDKRPWRVWKGVGSFLLFEFGRALRKKDGSQRGTHTLWVCMAEWRIHKARRELAHSESADRSIDRAAAALAGKKLEAIMLSASVSKRSLRHGVTFYFEGGHVLRAWAHERGRDDEDLFLLYSPGRCVYYRRNGTLDSISIEK